ncbi:META domain-containing protein [Microbacterium maritypicum]
MLTLAGCTGTAAPDDVDTAQPTATPATTSAISVIGVTWGEKPDTDLLAGTGPFLEFHSDGTFVGSAGCNGISGEWKQDRDAVTFGPTAMTQVGCRDIVDWVDFPATARITETSIILLDTDGAVIDELLAQD